MHRSKRRFSGFLLILALGSLLAACGGAEERKARHVERAQMHAARGELEKARVEYRNALQIDPRDVTVRMATARTLEALEDWRKAAAQYQRVLALDPEHTGAKVGLGKLYLLGDVPDKAAELVESVLAVAPGHADALVLRASLRAQAGDRDGARADLASVLSTERGHPNAVALLASMDAEQGRLEQAAQLLSQSLEIHRGHAGLGALYARILLASGNEVEAVAELERIVKAQPDSLKHRRHLATVYASLGRIDAGERTLREGVTRAPDSREAKLALVAFELERRGFASAERVMRGFIAEDGRDALSLRTELARLYEGGKFPTKARQEYQSVVAEADEESVPMLEARVGLARILAREGRLDDALAQVADVLKDNPRDRGGLTLRATIALMRNDPASAIVDFRVVVRDHEDALHALRMKARAHALNNEPEQALVDLRRVSRATPDDVLVHLEIVDLLRRLGVHNSRADEIEATLAQARRIVEGRLKRAPDDPAVHRLAGQLAIAGDDQERAAFHLQKAVEGLPDDVLSRTLLARALGATRDLDASLVQAQQAVELSPGDSGAQAQLAVGLVQLGRRDEAKEKLRQALSASPGELTLLEALARLQAESASWSALADTAARLKSSHPRQSSGWFYAGLASRGMGDVKASTAEFRRALEQSPHAVEPAIALARSDLEAGAIEQAQDRLARILERAPNDAGALNLKGELLIAMDRPQEAEAILRKVMELKPQWTEPQRNLALARARAGDIDGATEELRDGLGARRAPGQVAYELATLYERIGKVDLAIAQYEALLRSEPGSTVGANNLAMLLATYRSDEEALMRAMSLVEPLAAGGRPEFLDTLGWVQLRLGLNEKALETLQRAIAQAPEEPVIRYHLGMAYLAVGRTQQARTELEGALAGGFSFQGWQEARTILDRIAGS